MTWSLSDGRTFADDVSSTAELIEKLRKYNASPYHVILGLDNSDGHGVLIGLGGDVGYLNNRPNGNDPPYFSSVNPEIRNDDACVLHFEFGGADSEIPLRCCLPIDKVFEAIGVYFETELFPGWVKWELD